VDLSADARESFEAWVAARRDRLVRAAYLLTGDLAAAEDLLHDSLVKVARRWGKLRDGNPDAYIRRTMYHGHVSRWRAGREIPVAEPFGRAVDSADPDRDLVVRQALTRLPARQRAVIVLRYLDDVTERDAAEALGVTVGTVKSQANAALRKLREEAPELGELIGREGETR
jgi:RNA polymerase sigma-70 factor (sigma-E family)